MGVGGVGAHGERSSDDVELAGSRRGQKEGITSDLLTVGGRKKRETAGCELQMGTVCVGAWKVSDVTVYEDKRKKSSVHTALCLKRQVSN